MNNTNKSGLKNARENAKLNRLELASMLKIEESVLAGWESGGGSLSTDMLLKLINILDTSAEMILFNERKPGLNIESLSQEQQEIIFKIYEMMKNK